MEERKVYFTTQDGLDYADRLAGHPDRYKTDEQRLAYTLLVVGSRTSLTREGILGVVAYKDPKKVEKVFDSLVKSNYIEVY